MSKPNSNSLFKTQVDKPLPVVSRATKHPKKNSLTSKWPLLLTMRKIMLIAPGGFEQKNNQQLWKINNYGIIFGFLDHIYYFIPNYV